MTTTRFFAEYKSPNCYGVTRSRVLLDEAELEAFCKRRVAAGYEITGRFQVVTTEIHPPIAGA